MAMILHKRPTALSARIQLSGSKSLSNRVLIIKALSNLNIELNNLSESDDTKHLRNALELITENSNTVKIIDVGHAGTDMRFLTALLSITQGEFILTGSERLKQRPIAPLVEALQILGADIQYQNQLGYPPIRIKGKVLVGGKLSIPGDISSQFISALLLIAPCLKNGLELQLLGNVVSRPYINMTIDTMKTFGAEVVWQNNIILVKPTGYHIHHTHFDIESDWSSASYYYSIVALSPIGTTLSIATLQKNSLQADAVCVSIYNGFGVETVFKNESIEISKKQTHQTQTLNLDFLNCPDIAQTVACTCLGLNISFEFTGLQTLKVKETDRITALKQEFLKLNKILHTTDNNISYQASQDIGPVTKPILIDTYNDHRMAMAFAPLCLVYEELQINNADVVSKSYPNFWKDLKEIGVSYKSV